MPTIDVIRTLSGLAAADESGRKSLALVPIGDSLQVSWRRPRSGPAHRRYWALCSLVYENSELYGSAEAVSDHIKILAGHCETLIAAKTGEVWLRPKSISFASMGEDEFQDFWLRCVKVVCEQILSGVTEPEIEREILQLVGASTWAA